MAWFERKRFTTLLERQQQQRSGRVVDTGELLTLTQAGVKSLNTGFTNQMQTDVELR
jgi:hypothetical protein